MADERISPSRTKALAAQPVRLIATDEPVEPEAGTALCLSGGGYRAMLFHLGALWRLNEAGLLSRLDRISSVSGGSITAAALGQAWDRLDFDERGVAKAYVERVVGPVRELASHTLDEKAVASGVLMPGSIGEHLAGAYAERLFGSRTLQDLPDRPRFVLNATNLASGELWRFSKPYMADWRVGTIPSPKLPLASAVAASSAFPPLLSPFTLDLAEADWQTVKGNDLAERAFREKIELSDGGVYDNLGLETAWKVCKTVLVSDAGGHMAAEAEPHRDWPRQAIRVEKVTDNQVRDLRKRQIQAGYTTKAREGAYWGIRSDIAKYPAPDPLPCPFDQTLALAALATRLAVLDEHLQERLINWGYAICDAALRSWVSPTPEAPAGFPYPQAGVA